MRGPDSRALLGAALFVAAALLVIVQTRPGSGILSPRRTPQFAGCVTYNGQPLTGQMIVFAPRDLKGDNWGFAYTDKEGKFSVASTLRDSNMTSGTYRIFFRKPATPRYVREDRDGRDTPLLPASGNVRLPDRFYSADESGLSAQMDPAARWIRIDLRDDPRA